MDVLRKLILDGVHVFVTGDEEIVQYKFTNQDSLNIGAGEQVVVTIRREHKRAVVMPTSIVFEGVPI